MSPVPSEVPAVSPAARIPGCANPGMCGCACRRGAGLVLPPELGLLPVPEPEPSPTSLLWEGGSAAGASSQERAAVVLLGSELKCLIPASFQPRSIPQSPRPRLPAPAPPGGLRVGQRSSSTPSVPCFHSWGQGQAASSIPVSSAAPVPPCALGGMGEVLRCFGNGRVPAGAIPQHPCEEQERQDPLPSRGAADPIPGLCRLLSSGPESGLKSGLKSRPESGFKSGPEWGLKSGPESGFKSGLKSGLTPGFPSARARCWDLQCQQEKGSGTRGPASSRLSCNSQMCLLLTPRINHCSINRIHRWLEPWPGCCDEH